MSEEDETVAVSDRVEILSTEDEKIKAVGEILSSDTSRKILTVLFNQSLTANEISQKTEISLPLVIYHLKKMQDAAVVKIKNVGKNTKSHDMKYYTIDKFAIVILPTQMSKPAKTSKSLFNSFSRIHRIATLGAASIAAWFSAQFMQQAKQIPTVTNEQATQDEGAEMAMKTGDADVALREAEPEALMQSIPAEGIPPTAEPTFDFLWPIVAVLSVIVAGLIIELVIKSRQEKQLKS
ncbi:MAG TPA: winged helix-turn-helix domain-containing protein [Nitrosopumilaceae archaeon]|nr:winged helix-turn-helix domain-containing protein [Nitrosopumilaceae archaeon]